MCPDCGTVGAKMVANHTTPLVVEYYTTGKIDLNKMRSLEATTPQCIFCSNKQGGILSGYSKIMAKSLGLGK